MRLFSGNELGVLLGAYCLTWRTPRPEKPLVLTTIVSSSQLGAIARDLGAAYAETLTGFKWIENRALELEQTEGRTTVFGYEEALGYSVGDVVRDKDGISAALVFADLAGWCRARGVTPWGYLEEIQRAHGLFLSAQKSVTIPGAEGAATIAAVMDGFRAGPPPAIGGLAVVETRDYRAGVPGLPKSNVVAYLLEGGSRVTLRPSGTEPKIKYYFELRETPGDGEELPAAKARGEATPRRARRRLRPPRRREGSARVGARPYGRPAPHSGPTLTRVLPFPASWPRRSSRRCGTPTR